MTRRLHPGWLVALFAAILSGSTWMPWLGTGENGGGWANAIGGVHGSIVLAHGFGAGQLVVLLSSAMLVAGAMVGRGLSLRVASIAALIISLLLVALVVLYYQRNVSPHVSAEYGLYVGAVSALCAVLCSAWAVVSALTAGRFAR